MTNQKTSKVSLDLDSDEDYNVNFVAAKEVVNLGEADLLFLFNETY
jgi:hypothetical protein